MIKILTLNRFKWVQESRDFVSWINDWSLKNEIEQYFVNEMKYVPCLSKDKEATAAQITMLESSTLKKDKQRMVGLSPLWLLAT